MILADTSVWVDHLRKNDAKMDRLLHLQQILMHPFIIGEIALGHLRNRQVILKSLWELPPVSTASDGEVLSFIEAHSLFGSGIGYLDAHLLASLKVSGSARFWTRDRKLGAAAASLGLKVGEQLTW